MKKLLTLTLASAISLALIGCGDSDSKKTNPKDVVLNFSKKGKSTYDLNDYLFNKNQKSITKIEKTFTNKNGKRNYENLPNGSKKEKSYIEKTDVNGSTIKELKGNKLISTSVILDDKISQVTDELNTNLVRYVDKGDYFIKGNLSSVESGISLNGITVCKITGHQDSITVRDMQFQDILTLSCNITISTDEKQIIQGKPFEIKSESDYNAYLAKDIGEVSSTEEGCQVVKMDNKQVSSECEKNIIEIATIDFTN